MFDCKLLAVDGIGDAARSLASQQCCGKFPCQPSVSRGLSFGRCFPCEEELPDAFLSRFSFPYRRVRKFTLFKINKNKRRQIPIEAASRSPSAGGLQELDEGSHLLEVGMRDSPREATDGTLTGWDVALLFPLSCGPDWFPSTGRWPPVEPTQPWGRRGWTLYLLMWFWSFQIRAARVLCRHGAQAEYTDAAAVWHDTHTHTHGCKVNAVQMGWEKYVY